MTIKTSELHTLQAFESVEEKNAAIKKHRELHAKKLTTNARKVLDIISQYACKYYGVCYLSKNKMANMVGVTRRTIQRICDKLESLGIIVQHETRRATGDRRQSSNAIVIQPVIVSAKVDCHTEMTHQDNLLKNQNNNNTSDTEKKDFANDATKQDLIKKGLVTKLPTTLKQALAPFFDADTLYKVVGIVYKAKASIDKTITIEDNEQDYYNAIISTINAFKRGKVRNLEGLIYHAIKSTTYKISRQHYYGLI